jgi:hypothetical protein
MWILNLLHSLLNLLGLFIIWALIGLLVYYENSKIRTVQNVLRYKRNQNEYYVEYRRWKIWWGLTIDSQKEVNELIDSWNERGYICTYFENSGLFPNVTIFRFILILFVNVVTIGFVNFYVGPTLLLCKKRNNGSEEVHEYGDFVSQDTIKPSTNESSFHKKSDLIEPTLIGEVLTYHYENGTTRATGTYRNGKKEGKWRFYSDTGRLWQTGEYVNDRKNGKWVVYDNNGEYEYSKVFRNGEEVRNK